MMKNLFKIGIISFIIFSLFSFFVFSLSCPGGGIPDYPQTFQGYAKYGTSVLASKTVIATLDGNEFSLTTDSNGYYHSLIVERCGNSAATTITFTVCARTANETATFSSSTTAPTDLNLTISSDCPTTTTTTTGGGGGGGGGAAGGGGGGAAVPSKTDLDSKATFTTVGYTAKQTQGDTATFTLAGTQYTAELTKLKEDSATITVGGQSTILNIGQTAQFDVNGDGVNDISVTLKGVEGGRAEIVYKMLAKAPEKPAEEVPPEVEKKEEVKPPEKEVIPPPSKAWVGWAIVAVIVLIGLIVYFRVAKKKKPIK